MNVPLDHIAGVLVGTQQRHGNRFAMHPGWRHANGPHNVLDDVAIVQLDQPITGVAPVALGGARMLCAIDVDGLEPLSSGCNGDSGGPLYTGTTAAPVLLGVVSWGSTRCGADHTPLVFADVARYRDFITDPAPTLAPSPTAPPKVTGSRRVGGRLTCAVDGYTARPTKVEVSWQRQGGRKVNNVGHARTYRVGKADAGHPLVCTVTASNDGGSSTAPFATSSMVKIPR
jgi:hypothetical protein